MRLADQHLFLLCSSSWSCCRMKERDAQNIIEAAQQTTKKKITIKAIRPHVQSSSSSSSAKLKLPLMDSKRKPLRCIATAYCNNNNNKKDYWIPHHDVEVATLFFLLFGKIQAEKNCTNMCDIMSIDDREQAKAGFNLYEYNNIHNLK